jgi:uncharacterized protein
VCYTIGLSIKEKRTVNSSNTITPEKVEKVIGRIIEFAHPKKIILFGSYVKGNMRRGSDLDVLVVGCDDIENIRKESVRIREVLDDIIMPMDIVVVRESHFERSKDKPGLIYREALRTGKVVYGS